MSPHIRTVSFKVALNALVFGPSAPAVGHAQFFRSASKSLNKHKYESKFLRFYF